MKKMLIIGVALVAITSVFFLQCEKTESLGDLGEISFKQLNTKVWYLDKMTVKGEEVIFDEAVSVEFGKDRLTIVPNANITCNVGISYPSSNQFMLDASFDCLDAPNKINPKVKRLLQIMQGVYQYEVGENTVTIIADGLSLQLKDKWSPRTAFNFDGTAWEVKELLTEPKDISIVWEKDFPKLRFEEGKLFMNLSKNACFKAYLSEKGNLILDDAFSCSTNPCCGNDQNTKLAESLSGEMIFEMKDKELMSLKNSFGTQIIIKQVPRGLPNTVPGEVK